MKFRTLATLLGILVLLGSPLPAADIQDSGTPETEQRAKLLEAKLMAPCCFSETIDQHQSSVAREMRKEVRQWLAQGSSEDEILARYVSLYGTQILAVPPQEGFNRLLFWVPFIMTVVFTAGLILLLWTWYRRAHEPSNEDSAELQ